MIHDLDTSLTADLARTLEFDPALTRQDAVIRIARLAAQAGVPGLEKRLERLASELSQRGVINPRYLSQDDNHPHFFLANGRPGLFGQVISDAEHSRAGISQYVVYGHWDSVLVLYGSAEQATRLMGKLMEGAYEEPTTFVAKEVLLAYRHQVPRTFEPVPGVTDDQINEIALEYDNEDTRALRDKLLESNVLIGSALTVGQSSPYPINAFIGISVRAHAPISGTEVLNVLMDQDDLRNCMTHLFEVDHGKPFHYFARIACATMHELDEATNAIAFASRAGIRFEGETLVVAHGSEQLPLVRKPPDIASLSVAPDVTAIFRTAQQVFDKLGTEERASFNLLPSDRQMATLRGITGLRSAVEECHFDGDVQQRVGSAITIFAREITRSEGSPNLTGAVMEIASTTERCAKRLLLQLASSVYGENQIEAQRQLRLPNRKIWNLPLGKVVQGFRAARGHGSFADLEHHIPDDWINRLDRFTDERNSWAHGDTDGTPTQIVDLAYDTMREGIQITEWLTREARLLGEAVNQAAAQQEEVLNITLPARSDGSDFAVLVSHSPGDEGTASRLAKGLDAMGYRAWLNEWVFSAGDSIVERLKKGAHAGDVLLVVLSAASLQSRWVNQELNSDLMRALDGQNVLVIPVVSENCDVPTLILAGQDRINCADDFENGFISIVRTLREHRDARE